MVMTNRRGHEWKLKDGEENLRRKEGQDKEDDNCQKCGGNVRKEKREKTKELEIKKKKRKRQAGKDTSNLGVYEVQVKMKNSQ